MFGDAARHATKIAWALTLALVPSSTSTTAQTEQPFDWSSLLVEAPSDVAAALSGVGTCEMIEPLAIRVPVITRDTKVGPWLRGPISGRMSPRESIDQESDHITTLSCTVGRAAEIRTFYFGNSLFRIELKYPLCDDQFGAPALMCSLTELHERSYDQSLFAAFKNKTAYTSSNPPQPTSYFDNYGAYLDDPIASGLLHEADCPSPMLQGTPTYHCIVDADLVDGKWHSVAMFEFVEPGFFGERLIGRLASHQLFVLVDLEQQALDALQDEAQVIVDAANAERQNVDDENGRVEAEKSRREEEINRFLGGETTVP